MTQTKESLDLQTLALYLGGATIKTRKGATFKTKIIDAWVLSAISENFFDDYKLYLRPLSDLAEEEAVECYEIMFKCKPKDHINDVVANIIGLCEDEVSAEVFKWLLSKGFDLFNLIGKGLAIKTNRLNSEDLY